MRWPAGTRISWKYSCAVVEPCRPIFSSFGPTSSPGVSRSTTKAVMALDPAARSSVAKTVNTSAIGAFVMNVFAPSMT